MEFHNPLDILLKCMVSMDNNKTKDRYGSCILRAARHHIAFLNAGLVDYSYSTIQHAINNGVIE